MLQNIIKQYIPQAIKKLGNIDTALATFIQEQQQNFDNDFSMMLINIDDKVYVVGATTDENNVVKQQTISYENEHRKAILVSEFLGNLLKKAL